MVGIYLTVKLAINMLVYFTIQEGGYAMCSNFPYVGLEKSKRAPERGFADHTLPRALFHPSFKSHLWFTLSPVIVLSAHTFYICSGKWSHSAFRSAVIRDTGLNCALVVYISDTQTQSCDLVITIANASALTNCATVSNSCLSRLLRCWKSRVSHD